MPRSVSARTRSSLISRSRPGWLPAAAIGRWERKGAVTSCGRKARTRRRPRRGGPGRAGRPNGRGTGSSRQLLEVEEDDAGEADARLVRQVGPAVQVLDLTASDLEAAGYGLAVGGGAELAQVRDAVSALRRALQARMLAGDVGEGVEPQVDPDVGGFAADHDLILGHQIGLGAALVLEAEARVGRERIGELAAADGVSG